MKKSILVLVAIPVTIAAVHLAVKISNHEYLYRGISETYLKGRTGPAIDEYSIFPYRVVKKRTPQPLPQGHDYNRIEFPGKISGFFNEYGTIGFLVLRNDSLRYEHYWDNFGPASHTNSFSMAKTIVSILTGIALAENKIKSVDQQVGDFLPEFNTGEKSKITIRHLLTMSTGLDFDESYVSPFAYPAKAYYGTDLKSLTFRYKVAREPGKIFEYLSGNTQILGFVLEKATGMKISTYATEKLWEPLGSEQDAFWSLDQEQGDEKAFCCFNSNLRDFARIGQLYLHEGNWNGQQIVSPDYVRQSVEPEPLLEKDGTPNHRYGFSWWLLHYRQQNIFYAQGINGQYIIVFPEKKMVVVRLGKKRILKRINGHHEDLYSYIDAVIDGF
ncbi:MAG: serine hydrolase [Bacteroidetes bacterium]|nr:serine hydrolase [Bacteroidota bacterium]